MGVLPAKPGNTSWAVTPFLLKVFHWAEKKKKSQITERSDEHNEIIWNL